MEKPDNKAPIAKKITKELKIHNDVRRDDYYWLREREDEEVINYLHAENAYREAEMKHTEGFQKSLFEEIKGRIKEQDESVPYKKKGYWYYVRYEEGMEHPIYCRKKGSLDADEEIIIDENEMAKGYDFYQIGGLSISPDNKWLAFGEDTLSRRIYSIRFKNLKTGIIAEGSIENTTGSIAWAADSQTVFYTVKDETLRPYKIFKHERASKNPDVEVYHEKDSTFTCGVYKSKSDQYIMIGCHSTVSNEYHFLEADKPKNVFKCIQERERNLEYGVAHFGEHWYIRTNKDGASNFKLMKTVVGAPSKENWEDVVPHREDVYLEGLEIFKNYLVLEERENGLTKIRISPWDNNVESHYIAFTEETYTAGIGNNPDFESEVLRYGYSSLTTPSSVMDYNMRSREKKLLKQQEVVGGHNPEEYHSERIWATADDGTKVPMSVVYKKSTKKKAGNPVLLYGYGSYGITVDPGFSSTRLSLLDRGFVFVIAHIRGGQYLGRAWYEDGKMLKKRNTFTDFIACAEKLIADKITSPEHLYAMGGSAGGLLMGAVMNMKPEIFKGIIAAVPFVDVVTTMLDESIPLTTGEYDEWGNPNEEEYYTYMKSYSPYDNVQKMDYPALLITTGLHDSQVQYWEPAKWIAKLRTMNTSDKPMYMFTNMETGHSGASGRFEAYKETAMEYAFLFDLEGIAE